MCTGSVDLRPWLSQCLSHHKCDKGRKQNYMPPRVLDCRDSSLRLFDRTTVVKQNFRRGYATLSHCWGGEPMKFMLTTDNLEDCYKAINMTDLPKTFQDAIQVARRADINLVWIDSLCIVQAGPLHSADWQMHVTEMSEIYTNCILNIAAAHSTNSNGGCFVQRSNANLSVTFMQNVIKSCNESYAIIPKYFGSHAKQPLNRRAWVYQERLLSPRIIHYTESDVWWECAECYLPSTFYYGLPSTYKSGTNMYPPWDPDGKFRVEFSWEPREMVDYGLNERQADDLTHWKRTVEWYSQLDITYDRDVFPAIGAIASRLNEHVYCTDYIAGFFKSDLPQSLIFERHTTKARSVYVAPSWSWASAQGEIKFIGAPGVPTAVIKSIETRLVNARNKLGQLLSASITLDTHVLRLTFDPTMWQHYDGYSARDPNIQSELWKLSRDGAEVMKLHSESSFYLRWDDPKRPKHLELHLIRIFRDDGLIVVPASIPEAFERVGTWTIRFWKRSGILIVKEALFRRRFKRTAIALV
ncbi:heterokaryon incompatibility protein-domain-containing protein [Hyaloscypha finlandica]|nr:heterokaryon incompatibility protein-domain-containing protein [Hyaloscypha finlandica]